MKASRRGQIRLPKAYVEAREDLMARAKTIHQRFESWATEEVIVIEKPEQLWAGRGAFQAKDGNATPKNQTVLVEFPCGEHPGSGTLCCSFANPRRFEARIGLRGGKGLRC